MLNLRLPTAAVLAAALFLGVGGPAAAASTARTSAVGAQTSAVTTKAEALQLLHEAAARKRKGLRHQKEALSAFGTLTFGWPDDKYTVAPARWPAADLTNLRASVRSVDRASTLRQIRVQLRYVRSIRPRNYNTMAYGLRNAVRLQQEIDALVPLVPEEATWSPLNRHYGLVGSATAIHGRSPASQLDATRSKVPWVEEAVEKMRHVAGTQPAA